MAMGDVARRWPVLDVVRGVGRSNPALATVLSVLVLVGGLLPVAVTVVTGRVIGAIPAAADSGLGSPAGDRLTTALVLFAGVYVASFAVASVQQPLATAVGLRFALFVRESVLDAATAPVGTAHLEDAAVADELALIENAEVRQALSRSIVPSLTGLGSSRLAGIGQAVVLFTFAWWAPVVVGASALLAHRWLRREVATFLSANQLATNAVRRANYFRELAVGATTAKEVRVFGLPDWATESFTTRWKAAMGEVWRERASHRLLVVQVAASSAFAYGVVFFAIGRAALDGSVGLGDVAVYAGAAVGMMNLGYAGDVETLVRQGAPILQRALRIRRSFELDADVPTTTQPPARASREPLQRGAIRFDGVAFSYPGATAPVFEGLTLDVPAARSLAIVGANGSGKTTLIKLLARLREPTEGTISAGGVPLDQVPPEEWRARLGVIFQDFVRYELSLRDNVGFGSLRLLDDEQALRGAMHDAGASTLVDEIGWHRVLSRAYEGGADLSGGQWQKVALARALVAVRGGADVLILDEPTANLDVRAEAELFERFLDLTRGLTTILISHRFSTVRRCDRICVLDGGRMVEEGSHEELMAASGRYATMFTLQASRFADNGDDAGARSDGAQVGPPGPASR